jgi:hypothetical protein
VRTHVALLAILLLGAALAGCTSKAPPKDTSTDVAPELAVTATTGGIRGLIVDQAVVPVPAAKVTLSGGTNKTTDKNGLFNFTGLAPGDYFVIVAKPGFKGVQAAATVVAGVSDPPIVKVLLERLSTAQPYLDFYKLDGFYDCASAVNIDTDTCDWVYRTGWDVANDSGHPVPVAPRSFFGYHNTQFIDIPADAYDIIQEGFWTDPNVHNLWVMIDKTPIDASCDCSDTYSNVIGPNPTFNRIDRFATDGSNNTEFHADFINGGQVGSFPAGQTVAARGFIPFQKTPGPANTDPNQYYSVAQNFRFTVITSVFHNYVAPEGWTFETKDNYKIG